MGITNADKQIDKSTIECGGELKVTLALAAAPDITENPKEIALLLDRSGSMVGSPLANMKKGAKAFVEIIAEATGGLEDGVIGSGSSIGIISFATEATIDTPLTTSVELLEQAIDNISASGYTNHADAFAKAISLFDSSSTNGKVIVMFTDGKTTAGAAPEPVAAQAKAEGIVIYCIGLIGSDGIDVNALNEWATDPDESHVVITPDAADLEELFRDLAADISKAGATDIVIDEKINEDFIITEIDLPTKGTVTKLDDNTLQWKIAALGTTADEGAALEFYIKHIAGSEGEKMVNASISYSDNEGNLVVFPEPQVKVECNGIVITEPCPEAVEITVAGCQDFVTVDAGEVSLGALGRILQLSVTLKDVCPGKRIALAVLVSEVDAEGNEKAQGMKTLTIPAHEFEGCKDETIKNISLVLPEESDGSGKALCRERKFKVRILANYIDFGYECSDTEENR